MIPFSRRAGGGAVGVPLAADRLRAPGRNPDRDRPGRAHRRGDEGGAAPELRRGDLEALPIDDGRLDAATVMLVRDAILRVSRTIAASISVPDSVREPLAYYRNNTVNSRNLMETAIKCGVKHFILLSALCVQKPRLEFQHAKLAFEKALIESGLIYSIMPGFCSPMSRKKPPLGILSCSRALSSLKASSKNIAKTLPFN